MVTKSDHKFDEEIKGISYRQYLRDAYAGRIELIRELEGILGKNRTHEIIERFYTHKTTESMNGLMEREGPIDSMSELVVLMKKLKANPFSQKTQTDEFPESEPGTFQSCTKECLYAEVFKELDAGDLGLIMLCNGDVATAEIFHPNVRLERTKTLMQGDDCCDFKYVWDE